ncbi:hypothetical protein BDM02DRAFT_3184463 [Thelephora ganbajun]|uniref:Uncharacterized protein n=1 Tax=Thelephora ganbajun TaxID=370292 RepID=A0ACB6ZPM5_THEGA|nr:hypothetical protein BDM02DRAFT_3184463 [Thelephora ganbajun]
MSSLKPLDVVILRKIQDGAIGDSWEPYQEYGVKAKKSKSWSCYILAKEDEILSVRCTNTTKKLLAIRISVDACYVQQYLLRPKGEAGDTLTCHGTGSHSMTFGLVSALTREGKRLSRLPSDTGCINVTVYENSCIGDEILPPEKPVEQLELPVSMDGTFWELCVRLTGDGPVIGQPSPHAAEISELYWKKLASLNFNYRTEDELFSGRIRGIEEVSPKQTAPTDTGIVFSTGKRKRESIGDDSPSKRRDRPSFENVRKKCEPPTKVDNPAPGTTNQPESNTGTVSRTPRPPRFHSSFLAAVKSKKSLSSRERSSASPNSKLESDVIVLSDDSSAADLEPPPVKPRPLNRTPRANSSVPVDSHRQPARKPSTKSSSGNLPIVRTTDLATQVISSISTPAELPQAQTQPQPQPAVIVPTTHTPTEFPRAHTQSQPQPSVAVPTITPPPTPHDNPATERPTAESTNEICHTVPTLATFLDEASPFKPLGFLAKDLQAVGVSTLAELKIIARKPEAFRTKIPVLADLREREQYLWMMFRKATKKLLEGDDKEQSTNNLVVGDDPVSKFVRSLGGGEWINFGALVDGLRGAGISSEKDLLVLSRNLEEYMKNIPFLWEFAASNKFGWLVFQAGLEGLPGQKTSKSVQAQDRGAGGEGHAYVKWFLDTIDSDKPLGYLANDFAKIGLTDRTPLLHVAEDIGLAVDAMPFFQDLASRNQLVWAMISVGFENLVKSR